MKRFLTIAALILAVLATVGHGIPALSLWGLPLLAVAVACLAIAELL